ncbi:MAG: AI-2E family transporter [Deltaproteobacteria bacterium]|jgi:predicted PurR-regulated permease PerM|nr:AI-2E family transporter [Deltaproteobacteria bacterium]
MNKEAIHKWVLLLLVFFISALFLSMIRQFLMAIFLAGIFSALSYPLYRRFEKWFKGRRSLASVATLILIVFVVIIPLGGLLGIITGQAIKVGETVKPWVEQQLSEPDAITNTLKSIPFYDRIEPYRNLIFKKAGEMVGGISGFLIKRLRSVTLGTVNFLFMLFIMLYTMFFFLMDGDKLIHKILYYLPLEDQDERRMLDKFTSVTRATLKGTAVIGILQGALAGAAFAVVGIDSAVFWGTVMAVLSFIPGIGTALVWGPAVIILAATGHLAKAIGLGVFCAAVVGSIDNLLRPILVGRDTQMHELMILFGTLGGIIMFGVVGIIIGPIVAALFVTIWDIYGLAFQDMLPGVMPSAPDEAESKKKTSE